ncbi:unnamed protein product [Caenorhabditis bovis]|uniref:Ubiquitin carboxyl-terminal hydrolase n=1 Tax=Caenorhabditis bovis TaxID=2654633 RepID=A0A8S1EUP0_9PELO|nr:unnamed protein product [Caenorhabditis bovis]
MIFSAPCTSTYSNKSLISGAIFGGAAAAALGYFYWTSSSCVISEKSRKTVAGLANKGNTCYLNSLLQALASCPSFLAWLHNVNIEEAGIKNGFIHSLRNILNGLNDENGGILNAQDVVQSLSSHGWNITFGVENDLYELFNVFVTTWEEELKNSRSTLLHQGIENCQSAESLQTANRKLLSFQRCADVARLDARLRAPCVGLTATEFRCCNSQCRYRTIKYESFTALTLSIPNVLMGSATSIEALLRRFFCSEIIRDAICDKCKQASRKQQGFLKKHGIVKLPQTLMIRIERVGMLPSGSLKLSEHVAFGECLSLQEVCFRKNPRLNQISYETTSKWQLPDGTSRVVGGAEEFKRQINSPVHLGGPSGSGYLSDFALIDGGSFVSERRETQKYAYQLRAVSEHRGGPYSGHFVTYRRGPAPNHHSWYCTNDANVSRVTYSQVAMCQGYMLFYERIRPHRFYDRT